MSEPFASPGEPPRLPRAETKTRKPWGWIVFGLIATALLAVSVLANTALMGLLAVSWPLSEEPTHRTHFREKLIGGDEDSDNKIAVVYVQDLISFSAPGFVGEEGMVGDIKEQLLRARQDPDVKAILLAIESPGGEVTASDVIHHAVLKAKEDGRPVVACMGALAASGGYYVAVAADRIVAHPTTLTGSIGVIFHLWNYRGLMDKIGLKPMVYKSGKMKDMLSPEKNEAEITPEEREIVNQLVMTDYNRFVKVVAEGRRMKVQELKEGLADGRVLSGEQAFANKFVDRLGYFEDAFAEAKALAKIKDARMVKFEPMFSLRNFLGLFAESRAPTVRVQLTPETFSLEPGRLYYLPPGWLR